MNSDHWTLLSSTSNSTVTKLQEQPVIWDTMAIGNVNASGGTLLDCEKNKNAEFILYFFKYERRIFNIILRQTTPIQIHNLRCEDSNATPEFLRMHSVERETLLLCKLFMYVLLKNNSSIFNAR